VAPITAVWKGHRPWLFEELLDTLREPPPSSVCRTRPGARLPPTLLLSLLSAASQLVANCSIFRDARFNPHDDAVKPGAPSPPSPSARRRAPWGRRLPKHSGKAQRRQDQEGVASARLGTAVLPNIVLMIEHLDLVNRRNRQDKVIDHLALDLAAALDFALDQRKGLSRSRYSIRRGSPASRSGCSSAPRLRCGACAERVPRCWGGPELRLRR